LCKGSFFIKTVSRLSAVLSIDLSAVALAKAEALAKVSVFYLPLRIEPLLAFQPPSFQASKPFF
jgi:hypothetical protein